MALVQQRGPSTPSRKRRASTEVSNTPFLVTPSVEDLARNSAVTDQRARNQSNKVCRQLSMPSFDENDDAQEEVDSPVTASKRSYFGRNSSNDSATVQPNTRQVYALVNKMTGSIGGNGKYFRTNYFFCYFSNAE